MNNGTTTTMLAALALALCLTAPVALARQQQEADVLLQEALHKEMVDGDLEGAISLYQKIVDNFSDARRSLVAHALVQMGKSYEKLGVDLVEEARQAYEQVVRDYTDQPDMVAEARGRLEAMEATVAATAGPDEPTALTIRKVLDTYFYGSLSPDGRYFSTAYAGSGSGENLGLYDMKTGEYRDLTDEGTWESPGQWADASIWSPDSKQIAYDWFMCRGEGKGCKIEIRIVGVGGGAPRIVTRDTETGTSDWVRAWSSDGKYILAAREIHDEEEPLKDHKTDRIVLVDVETGSTKTVKRFPETIHTEQMSLSPDGRYVAYETFTPENKTLRNIHIVSVDGQFDQPLVEFPGDDHRPFWTPDGSGVVFESDRSGSPGIWYVAVAEGKKAREPRLVHAATIIQGYGFSNDGTYYYAADESDVNILVADVDLDQGTLQVQPEKHTKRVEAKNWWSNWSPDGTKLSYLSRRAEKVVLVIRDAQSGEERDLNLGQLNINLKVIPQWSPDGKSILVQATAGDGGKGQSLYLVDVETEQAKRLLVKLQGNHPAFFTPDGAGVVFFRHADSYSGSLGPGEIVEQNLESGTVRVIGETNAHLSDTNLHLIYMSLSPDGSQLAYFENVLIEGETGADLVVMSVKDGSTRVLIPVSQERPFSLIAGINWTPDGTKLLLAFGNKEHTQQQLYLVDAVSGERKPIGNPMNEERNMIKLASMHPNGKEIAYSSGTESAHLWALENLVFDQ